MELLKWSGTHNFTEMNDAIVKELRFRVSARMQMITKRQQERALHNFGVYKIGLVTGRSRALYAVTPLTERLSETRSNMQIDVGYTSWPDRDIHSPNADIPFYPSNLNFGTQKMAARPYHTAAVEQTIPEYYDEMDDALDDAIRKAASFGGSPR